MSEDLMKHPNRRKLVDYLRSLYKSYGSPRTFGRGPLQGEATKYYFIALENGKRKILQEWNQLTLSKELEECQV